MSDSSRVVHATAPVDRRAAAIEAALEAQGWKAGEAIAEGIRKVEEEWQPRNGARLVAKAWCDPAFRARPPANATAAAAELGFELPRHHRHLVFLEDTPRVHNVICCTLCSCTAFTIIGLPPDWYKDLEYRSRIVRQSRSVLREMGLALAPDVEVRVWDTTADTRYMVLPVRPPHTEGWSEERLAAVVTKESMIGVARLPGT